MQDLMDNDLSKSSSLEDGELEHIQQEQKDISPSKRPPRSATIVDDDQMEADDEVPSPPNVARNLLEEFVEEEEE